MAAPQCMSDDDQQAVFVGTFLQTGDAVALCDTCLVSWSAAMLNTMTGIDPTPFLQAISEEVPAAAEGAPTDEPPPPAPHDTDTSPPGSDVLPDSDVSPDVMPGSRPPDPPTRRTGRGRKGSGDPPTGTENPVGEQPAGTSEDTAAAA